MIREKLYHKTIDILVAAYFNDTLEHGYCQACAVGNIVAANMGYKKDDGTFYCMKVNWSGPVRKQMFESYDALGIKQVESTGYSKDELRTIEIAFEMVNRGNSKDEYMFNGLMAVVSVLDEIHENKDSQITKDTKGKFNRNPVVKVCEAYEAETTSKSS